MIFTAIVIGIGALLAFIAWDWHRIANSAPGVDASTSNVTKSNRQASALISLTALVIALSEFLNPKVPPFTGRLAFIYETAYAISPYGVLYFWMLIAAVFAAMVICARLKG